MRSGPRLYKCLDKRRVTSLARDQETQQLCFGQQWTTNQLMMTSPTSAWSLLVLKMLLFAELAHGTETEAYTFRKVAEGYLPSGSPLADLTTVKSSVQCAALCSIGFRSDCMSYAHSRALLACRIYADQGSGTIQSPGFKLFHLNTEGSASVITAEPSAASWASTADVTTTLPTTTAAGSWYGSICDDDEDCPDAVFMECREASCQCRTGYHFTPGQGTCHTSCTVYGSTFYGVPGACINGHNDVTDHSGKTLEECQAFCIEHNCRTFEHGNNKCYLSQTTKLDAPHSWDSECGVYAYYQRNCA